jgi:hypothetical protein
MLVLALMPLGILRQRRSSVRSRRGALRILPACASSFREDPIGQHLASVGRDL